MFIGIENHMDIFQVKLTTENYIYILVKELGTSSTNEVLIHILK